LDTADTPQAFGERKSTGTVLLDARDVQSLANIVPSGTMVGHKDIASHFEKQFEGKQSSFRHQLMCQRHAYVQRWFVCTLQSHEELVGYSNAVLRNSLLPEKDHCQAMTVKIQHTNYDKMNDFIRVSTVSDNPSAAVRIYQF
jgi:hypothetical protein